MILPEGFDSIRKHDQIQPNATPYKDLEYMDETADYEEDASGNSR